MLISSSHRRVLWLAPLLVIAVAFTLGFAPQGPAPRPVLAPASPIFLQLDGVPGEVTVPDQPSGIAIQSLAWGATAPAASSVGAAGGKSRPQPVVLTKTVGKATPKLIEMLAVGKHLKDARITLTRGGRAYLTYTLQDVLVSGYSVKTGEGDAMPMEQFSLNFTKITISYVDPDGNAQTYTWDLNR